MAPITRLQQEEIILKLNDNRLYNTVNIKIINKILYILSACINTVSYKDIKVVFAT